MFFMVLAKTAEELQHVENVVALICGAIVLIFCAIIASYLLERRVSEWECRKKLQLEASLARAKNEVDREKENFRQIDISLRNIIDIQKEQLKEKDSEILSLREQVANYKSQMADVKLGKFNNKVRWDHA